MKKIPDLLFDNSDDDENIFDDDDDFVGKADDDDDDDDHVGAMASPAGVDSDPAKSGDSEAARNIRARWGGEKNLLDAGWLGVPRRFFLHVAAMGLTPAETAFVLHVMSFKWSEADPYPSYALLAHRMGVSVKQVQKYANQLRSRGLLVTEPRRDDRTNVRSSNTFNLQPLFDLLGQRIRENPGAGRPMRPR